MLRERAPWIIGGALTVIAAVLIIVIVTPQLAKHPGPSFTPLATSMTPTPTPLSCQPDPTHTTPWPCTPEQQASQTTRNAEITKAHHDAEAAYRAGQAEYYRMLNKGETAPTPALVRYHGGEVLAGAIQSVRQAHKDGLRLVGSPRIEKVHFDTPQPQTVEGARQRLTVCDTPNGTYGLLDGKRIDLQLTPLLATTEMEYSLGQWRAVRNISSREVKSCVQT